MKLSKQWDNRATMRFATVLFFSNAVSIVLFLVRSIEGQTIRYWFLSWNLLLAWLPVVFALWLSHRLLTTRWLTWQNIVISLLWLGFLPNSFYIVTDLIHLYDTGEVSLLYDAVMFMSFILNGIIAGFISLVVVHRELVKRFDARRAYQIIMGVLLLSSIAIYLGRFLRWNTWDVLINPAGILFDVSEHFINPSANGQFFVTTIIFFLFLAASYSVLWEGIDYVRGQVPRKDNK